MQWFKFYGQDFLTDPKMRVLTVEEKMCWVVLMCLANAEDKKGKISFLNEEEVMRQASVEEGSPMWEATKGFLDKFEELQMLSIDKTTSSPLRNAKSRSSQLLRWCVTLINFDARQDRDLSGAERQQRYRERLKIRENPRHHSNVTQRNESDARTDKNRIDKKRKEENSFKEEGELTRAERVAKADEIARKAGLRR